MQSGKFIVVSHKATFTCGSTLAELDLGENFKDVEIRDVIEKLYYSAGLEPICVYCGVYQPFTSDDHYRQCKACSRRFIIYYSLLEVTLTNEYYKIKT